jgi:ankyrin repeat protein
MIINKYKWFEAIDKQNIDLLKKYIENNKANIDILDIHGKNVMHYAILNNSRDLYVFGLENSAMLDLRDTFGIKPYNCLYSVDLNFFIEILSKYDDEFWFNTFTEHWFLDEKKQCLYRTMIESPISYKLNYLKNNKNTLYMRLYNFFHQEDWFKKVLETKENANSYILKNFDDLFKDLTKNLPSNNLSNLKKI